METVIKNTTINNTMQAGSHLKLPEKGMVGYACPSNIAIVKYWGKFGEQLPRNANLSFTLDACKTRTAIHYTSNKSDTIEFKVFVDGKENTDFRPKIQQFISKISTYVPFLKGTTLLIHTSNTFPHSAGIASSAAGFGALSMCIMEMEWQAGGNLDKNAFFNKASFLARLGSGSACRSVFSQAATWGEHAALPNSSNQYATPLPFTLPDNFNRLQDAILIVDNTEKGISSTKGHAYMHNHPFAEQRFKQANTNFAKILDAIKNNNWQQFAEISETEALSLHAMMMTSPEGYILLRPNSIAILEAIKNFRNRTTLPLCFTIDAGPNIHLLYPEKVKKEVEAFINNDLSKFLHKNTWIADKIGNGPQHFIEGNSYIPGNVNH